MHEGINTFNTLIPTSIELSGVLSVFLNYKQFLCITENYAESFEKIAPKIVNFHSI